MFTQLKCWLGFKAQDEGEEWEQIPVLYHADFVKTSGLYRDALNNVAWMSMIKEEGMSALQPLKTYEEYIREAHKDAPAIGEALIRRSDAGAVERYNALVQHFNQQRPTIESLRDTQSLYEYYHQFAALIDGNDQE